MRKTLEIYRSIAEQVADSIFVTDLESRVTFQNPEAQRVFGFTDEEIIGRTIQDQLRLSDSAGQLIPFGQCQIYRAAVSGVTSRDFIARLSRKDGTEICASCTASPLNFEGERIGALFVATDITARKMAEGALERTTEKLELALGAAQLGMFDYDPQRKILNWNPRLKELFDLEPDAQVDTDFFFSRIHPEDQALIRHTFERIADPTSGGRYQFEYRITGASGCQRWLQASGQMIYHDGKPVRQVGIVMDITGRKEGERRIREAAQHDSLTGLPNRALLFEYCEHLLAQSRRAGHESAVLFIDLDRFKPINDLYGHAVGDRVLQEVARRLLACTRKEDILSRLGGDEFILVLPRVQRPFDPATVAQHILHEITQPIDVDGLKLNVSPSIGISLYEKHGSDLDTLIRQADLAMYAAKRAGKNTYRMYMHDYETNLTGRLDMEIRLKEALDDNRMTLLYQPIIDVDSGELTGAEALIRMAGENGDLLAPDEFIPIIESAGLIEKLGHWVVHEACRQYKDWRAAGMPSISMAINVSAAQLRQQGFAEQLADALHDFGMDPGCLQVEITEGTAMANLSDTRAVLQRLHAMGVKIALDDFGTGYSNLSSLSSLPLDKLKIDPSFIRRLDDGTAYQPVIDTIIGMGHNLKLKVVGEGIESEQAMRYLQRHGCDQAQGYLFSRPMPAPEFESWYRNRAQHYH